MFWLEELLDLREIVNNFAFQLELLIIIVIIIKCQLFLFMARIIKITKSFYS